MRHIHRSIGITDRSSIGEARRVCTQMSHALGWDADRRNNLAIVTSEAASNILLHAHKGELLLCPSANGNCSWIDILALDEGPGMRDVTRALQDGYSTGGTPGQGLGAIARLSDEFSIHSSPGKGTACWVRLVAGEPTAASTVGAVNIPLSGETTCGDAYYASSGHLRSVYAVADGLGHGPGAAEAAEAAIELVGQHSLEEGTQILTRAHLRLKSTRGAAMSVAVVNHDQRTLTYAGIGNVSAAIVTSGAVRNLVSQNGTLGASLPRVPQQYTYPFERESMLVIFSDGLQSKLSVTGFAGFQARHPALLAGLVYRDFSRRRDDATVLIARLGVPLG